jgi:hypothetical protein
MQDVRFGFQAAAADVAGVPDQQLGRAGAKAEGAIRPISVKLFIADADEEVRALGRRRQKTMTRFAEEICQCYSSAMRKGRAA